MNDSAELQAFVKAAKEQGASDEFLVAMLREKGWPAKDVYALFAHRYGDQTGIALPEPPGRLEAAREAFFHLLAFATLTTWIFSIGSIWFELIEAWLPDPAVDRFSYLPVAGRTFSSFRVALPCCTVAGRGCIPLLQPRAGEVTHAAANHVASYLCGMRRYRDGANPWVRVLVDRIAFKCAGIQ
ncbi:MAG TPA: hypothetical protein VG273_01895 [Bryobacteraceae bacterium]|jgi:hypothetical protein|nr:hypothetical protein [Bryobacteraceae bacterium]